ncbi:hypothetical protein C4D60_Mb05t02670 [Musa balbisiana]|uniref:Uncharacterized protein n=1 Tax=Musa balbisiana TaxID=52838 RepID=A0A4V4H7W0_MUSBA|nr:hypothetical protein C4D60_Mb05t02670 [Musa balbisiana]
MYLVVDEHWHHVMLWSDRFCNGARWTVVIVTDFFEGATIVRLRSCHGMHLVVDEHWHHVMLWSDRFCDSARWTVVIVINVSG